MGTAHFVTCGAGFLRWWAAVLVPVRSRVVEALGGERRELIATQPGSRANGRVVIARARGWYAAMSWSGFGGDSSSCSRTGLQPSRNLEESVLFSNLHVGNLTFNTTSADLRAHFAQQGEVKEAELVTDLHSGKSRGFGFVEMARPDDAKAAISALDGHNVDGRDITVAIAKPRSR